MYVGITRARSTLMVSTLRRRKKGRDTIQGVPSRFIGEMKLHEVQARVDPHEKLRALRAAAAERAAQAAAGVKGRGRADAPRRAKPACAQVGRRACRKGAIRR